MSWDVEHENVQDSLARNVNAYRVRHWDEGCTWCVYYSTLSVYVYMQKGCLGGVGQASDPWTVLFQTLISREHAKLIWHTTRLYTCTCMYMCWKLVSNRCIRVCLVLPKVQRSLYFQHNSSSTHAALQLLLYVCILQPLKTHYRHTHSTYMYMHTHITTDACTHTLTIPAPHNCVHLHHHTY